MSNTRKKCGSFFLLLVVISIYLFCHNTQRTKDSTKYQSTVSDSYNPGTFKDFHPKFLFSKDLSLLYEWPKHHIRFYEETTASRFYPISLRRPDFTWALNYTQHRALVYKDYGSGCVLRIHTHRIHTQAHGVQLILDGISIVVNFYPSTFTNGYVYPYFHPISRSRGNGFGSFGYMLQFPFCYSQSAEVYLIQTNPTFENFAKSIDVLLNCGFHVASPCGKYQALYATITTLRMPMGRKLITTFSIDGYSKLEEPYKELAKYLDSYKLFTNPNCLQSFVKHKGDHVLYETNKFSGEITSIEIEIDNQMDLLWLDTFITVIVDDNSSLIDYVSLNGLFGISTVDQKFTSLFNGIAPSPCNKKLFRAIFKMPIPFTYSVKVVLHLKSSSIVYYDIGIQRKRPRKELMYLKIVQNSFSLHPIENSKVFLNISNVSGRYMGMVLSTWNGLRKDFPFIETDIDVWKDGLKLPVSYGTGLEDYFGYNGGCVGVKKQLPFQGCAKRSDQAHKADYDIRFYRYHVLDSVFFLHSLEIAMEGEKSDIKLQPRLSPNHLLELDSKRMPFVTATLFLYINSFSKIVLFDTFSVGDEDSRIQHDFTSTHTLECISLNGVRYTGSKHQNLVVNCRVCDILQPFTYTFKAKPGNDIVIRRHYNCVPFEWNEEAQIKINNVAIGKWFFPKGSLNISHALCDFEFAIDKSHIKSQNVLHIQPLTKWRDFKYEIFSIL